MLKIMIEHQDFKMKSTLFSNRSPNSSFDLKYFLFRFKLKYQMLKLCQFHYLQISFWNFDYLQRSTPIAFIKLS